MSLGYPFRCKTQILRHYLEPTFKKLNAGDYAISDNGQRSHTLCSVMENLSARPRLVSVAAGATVITVLLTVAATVAGLIALVTEAAAGAAALASGVALATASAAVLLTVAVGATASAAADTGADTNLKPGA
jgi:hypothetical protein